ncbi:MAG: hypothetical protein RBT64_03140 [Trichloromonas sp.]|nr:hypothetical protein [Trichloromonas sp.]
MLNVIVEDALSDTVMRKLLLHVGFKREPTVRIMRGNGNIRAGMRKFAEASRVFPHIVLTDLDKLPCPPALFQQWAIRNVPETMLFRVAVHEVESWLMADREAFAAYLSVALKKVPSEPDTEIDTKQSLFSVVRSCKKSRLRSEILPTPGSHIGPLYNEHFSRFAKEFWRVDVAAENSPSLARSLDRITDFCRGVANV